MSSAPIPIEQLVGNILKRIKDQDTTRELRKALSNLLERINDQIPGVAGALLLSVYPRSKPEEPLCSKGWDRNALRDQEKLRQLAEDLSHIEEVKYYE